VTGIPEKEVQEIYDILEVKRDKKLIIKEASFYLLWPTLKPIYCFSMT